MEYNFTYQNYEHEKAKSFNVDFYPASKKVSEAIDYDEVRIPKSVNHLECGLYVDNILVAFDNSQVVDHEENATISLNLPDSCMSDVKDVKAILSVTKLNLTDSIKFDISLGDDPGFHRIQTPSTNSADGVKLDSVDLAYSVEGKKAKKIRSVELSCIVTNSSSKQRLVYMCVSAKPNDIKSLLSIPSTLLFQNSFADEICLLGPGKSTKISVNIWDLCDKLDELGLDSPPTSEFASLHIYPLIMVFGDEQNEVIHLENAKLVDD